MGNIFVNKTAVNKHLRANDIEYIDTLWNSRRCTTLMTGKQCSLTGENEREHDKLCIKSASG